LRASIPKEEDIYFRVTTRGALVLCYSHWEGYFNDLTQEVSRPDLLIGQRRLAFRSVFARSALDSLINKEVKDDTIIEFLNKIEDCESSSSFDVKPLLARSNLDWARLEKIFSTYGVSWRCFNDQRIFIQHQLCRIRHEIAHGNDPRLKRNQVLDHIARTSDLIEELPRFFSFLSEHVWT